MLNEKRIKTIIVIALFLIESLVWTANGSGNAWSLGIIGGADGPTKIIVGKEEPNNPGQNQEGGQEADGTGSQGGGENPQPEDPAGNGSDSESGRTSEDDGNGSQTLEEAREKGFLILVNKENPIDKSYKPDDLTEIKYFAPDRSKAGRYLRAEAAAAFHRMVDKAGQEGIVLKMTTAYRSYDFQKILFDSYVEKEGEEAANKYSAKPGQSEHQTGLSVDVSSPSVGYQLSNEYGETPEGKWLAEHAHEFGFIIRFPKGKEDITGYQYEPWHIRYVGHAAAEEIYKEGLTLEEFLQENH